MAISAINASLLTKGLLKVKVIKVDSPTFFWVHLENCREDLDELVEDLTRRMKRKSELLHHRPDDVRLDEVVAIREGKRWQRGMVIRVERGNIITIALRDWGRIVQRVVCEVYILEERFRQLEWQAIPCGLAHVQTVGSKLKWPRRVNELLRLLVEKREGWIQIQGTHGDEAAAVDLKYKCPNSDNVNDVATLLMQMGCALHSSELMWGLGPLPAERDQDEDQSQDENQS